MKNRLHFFIMIITTIVIITIIGINYTYASYADFTEEDAQKQTEELIKEQENMHNVTEVKSTDNYLNSLQVKGFTLSPEFDKQNLEYTIKEEVKTNELEIEAKASNEKAQISGNGKIKIEENKNEYRIDVTAESGTVRTYIIKIKNDETSKTIEKKEIKTSENNEENSLIKKEAKLNDEQINNSQEETNKQNSNIWIYITVGILALIILIFIAYRIKHNKKRKRKH